MKVYTLPNFITLGNLSLGILGIWIVFNTRLEYAALCIIGSAILDFLDGLVARLTNTYSEIGKQLDSLADMVSFGVLPSFILFDMLNQLLPKACYSCATPNWWSLLAILPALFSALRLAKFNIDTSQENGFRGLPTPSNATVVASFVLISTYQNDIANELFTIAFLLGYSIIISLLMMSDIPMLSLKFKNLSWQDNKDRFIFILIGVVLLFVLKFAAIPLLIAIYVIYSLVQWALTKK